MGRLPPTRWRWCRRQKSKPRWKKPSRSVSLGRTKLIRLIARHRIAAQLRADVGVWAQRDKFAILINSRRAAIRLRRGTPENKIVKRVVELLRAVDARAPCVLGLLGEGGIGGGK